MTEAIAFPIGVIRTLKVVNGAPVGLEHHVAHFFSDIHRIAAVAPEETTVKTMIKNHAALTSGVAVLRITAIWQHANESPHLEVDVRPFEAWPEIAKVQTYQLSANTVSPFPGVKLSARAVYKKPFGLLSAGKVDEVLLVNTSGFVQEGTISNLICHLDGRWKTPRLGRFGVAGLARKWIIRCIETVGECVELDDQIDLACLQRADGVWLVNSVRGAVPIGAIDAMPIEINRDKTKQLRLWLKTLTG